MLVQRSARLLRTFKCCRNFSNSKNYINNSYLNYVQVTKNVDDKKTIGNEMWGGKTTVHGENEKKILEYIKEDPSQSGGMHKKGKCTPKGDKLDMENFINNSEGSHTREKRYHGDDLLKNDAQWEIRGTNQSDNNKRVISKRWGDRVEEEKQEKLYGGNVYQMDEKMGRKNEDNFSTHHVKSDSNLKSYNLHKCNNVDSLTHARAEHEKGYYKEEYTNEQNIDSDKFSDVDGIKNFREKNDDLTTDKVHCPDDDFLNWKEGDSDSREHTYSGIPTSENNPEQFSEKKNSNTSNCSNENEEKWMENEEDIPNIFEVDENLSEEEKKEKLKLIKLITEKLAGPLKSNSENNAKGVSNSKGEGETGTEEDSIFADNRPIAIEVDGPSHFYANSNRYTTYTKLKHRILTKLGYNVIHISYFDWRKLRNKSEREEFILKKLKEKNDEFLDDNDRTYYNERMNMIKEDYQKYMKEKKESSR
ncbi:RAP protein, putative [Plasmodium ovale]|uniref:RAP protein, putative n=1 Tax=Plasmodium ovale TaxID=36330 RepID=A0A1D3TKU1_PLAOA|nr:RAP protein, putative [Plasmodium ovale]